MTLSNSGETSYNPVIETWRFLAACIVVLCHYRGIWTNQASYWDLTDLKIYKYEKGMTTSAPIDSMTFTNGTGLSFQSDNDALNMFITYAFLRISSPYDYKLKFNSTTIEGGQNELLITEITDKAESIKCKATFTGTKGECSCMNELTSYKINGVTRTLNSSVEFDGIKGYKIRINP
ncbi:MAG: hypothetical protein EBU01_12030 [Crocinitomicaceae bacterium]|nr:hypothetical protein [Crocinitomicaceae bacterium]